MRVPQSVGLRPDAAPRGPTRSILMVAFHYPPFQGSSSVQRTLGFLRHLPAHGWRPTLLTAHPRAYPQRLPATGGATESVPGVHRAFALDAARHLAYRGRYSKWTALPDRWVSWFAGGVVLGLRLIRRERPAVLWSTFPIATCHLIGLALAALSGLPWVADFRDPMVDEDYPSDRSVRSFHRRIERWTVRRAQRVVLTTRGAREQYAQRYPGVPETRWVVLENGYDEEGFQRAESSLAPRAPGGPLLLVHSGTLYRSERDPRPFFDALGSLKRSGRLDASMLSIVLRASGDEAYHRSYLEQADLQDIAKLEPSVGYVDALTEMLQADALLLFQAANCNRQIPAKAYEYIRARRPILALTDTAGDTAQLLRSCGLGTVAPIDSATEIGSVLSSFVEQLRRGEVRVPEVGEVERYSRAARAEEFAHLLETVVRETSDSSGRS